MRPYGIVSPMFWTGATGKRLRGDCEVQTVAAYLMTGPHSHQTGIYYLPLLYLSHETGIPIEGARKALTRLYSENFCVYEEALEWVWVREMAAWQIGTGLSAIDKRCKGVQQYLETLPALPFLPQFVERYRQDFHLTRGIQAPSEAPLEGHSLIRTGSEQDQEQEGSLRETGDCVAEQPPNGSALGDTSKRRTDTPEGATDTAKGRTLDTAKEKTTGTPKRKTPKKPEFPLPEDFGLDPELEAYVQDALPDVDAPALMEKYRLQAETKQWRYANWRLAFMQYVRNAAPNSGHFATGQYPRKQERSIGAKHLPFAKL